MNQTEMRAKLQEMMESAINGGNFHSEGRFLADALIHARQNESEEFAEFVEDLISDRQSSF